MKKIITSDNKIIVPQLFVPRWYQIEVLQAFEMGFKRFLLLWHRKTGKDLTLIVMMFIAMMQRVGNYYYFFPSYAQGRKCLWEGKSQEGEHDGIPFLKRMPSELIKTIRNNEMYLELHNGSVLRVVGADSKKIDDIVGSGPIGIVMSEFGVEDGYRVVFDLMKPVLQQNGGWFAANGTPRGKNHYYNLYTNVINLKNEWFVSSLQTISPDFETGRYTGLITPEQIQMKRDEGTEEDTIEQEDGVSFTAGVKGSIFSRCLATSVNFGRICELDIDDHVWVETLFDLGTEDYTAIWFLQRVGSKVQYIDYYMDNDKDWPFYVNVMQNKGYRYRTHHLPHDAKNRYQMMKSYSPAKILRECVKESGIGGIVKVHKRPSDIAQKIGATRRRFGNYWFDSGRCKDGIILLENYRKRYDEVRKTFSKEVIHDKSSHCADALMLEPLTRHSEMYSGKNNSLNIDSQGNKILDKKSKSILNRFNR